MKQAIVKYNFSLINRNFKKNFFCSRSSYWCSFSVSVVCAIEGLDPLCPTLLLYHPAPAQLAQYPVPTAS